MPVYAQDIFREAFNNAWQTYGTREPQRREQIAHVSPGPRSSEDDWMPETA
jgi:cation transport regulator ChaB